MTADSSDTTTPEPVENSEAATGEAPVQALTINAQFIKDLSFEAPGTPGVFLTNANAAPDIKINVDVQAGTVQGKAYEVVLVIHAECKMGDQVAFIVELTYGGLFSLNMAEEHLKPVLLIECPRILFPFARNIIADVTRDGGFPPLMMNPLDFAAMYREGLQAGAESADEGSADA
jgi:preprotein translocase subunit SecB